jgi:hypothetical protein
MISSLGFWLSRRDWVSVANIAFMLWENASYEPSIFESVFPTIPKLFAEKKKECGK